MWLQLALGLFVSLAAMAGALAQERDVYEGQATARTLVYSDDDATTVVTTLADAELDLPANIRVGAELLLDSVSSASVDVVSAATGRWQEDRVEVGLRAGYQMAKQELSLGLVRSEENDWRSYSASIGTAREFFERNTRVSADYAYTSNQVGRASDPRFEKALRGHSLSLGIAQLVDRKTRVGASYDLQLLRGFQSSPYRYVSAADGTTVAELHPDARARHALAGFVQRSLHASTAMRAAYRLYRDDWGIVSHTLALTVGVSFAQRFHANLEGRFYQQNKADFYKRSYPTSYRYMSADRELSTFWDLGGQARVAAELGPVEIDAKLGAIHYRFRNFDPLATRRALLIGAGATLLW